MFLGFLKFSSLSLMWSHLIEMFPKGEIGNRYISLCMFWLFPHTPVVSGWGWSKMALALSQGKMWSPKKMSLSELSSRFSLCWVSVVLISYCCSCLIAWLFSSQDMFIHALSRHMFLVSHSHTLCLRYSLSNGCWLRKDPQNLGGVFRTPPISRDQQAFLQTPQDVAPRAGNGKVSLDYGIKGLTHSISGKKTNIDFNCSISF